MSILLGSLKLFRASVGFIENRFLPRCSEPYWWCDCIWCGLLLNHTLKLARLDRGVGFRDWFLLLRSRELTSLDMWTMLLLCEIDWSDTSCLFCMTVCNLSCHLSIANILATFQIYSSSSTANLRHWLWRIVAHAAFRALFFSQGGCSYYRIRLSW